MRMLRVDCAGEIPQRLSQERAAAPGHVMPLGRRKAGEHGLEFRLPPPPPPVGVAFREGALGEQAGELALHLGRAE